MIHIQTYTAMFNDTSQASKHSLLVKFEKIYILSFFFCYFRVFYQQFISSNVIKRCGNQDLFTNIKHRYTYIQTYKLMRLYASTNQNMYIIFSNDNSIFLEKHLHITYITFEEFFSYCYTCKCV